MKQKKPFKMHVPESDFDMVTHGLKKDHWEGANGNYYNFTRQEIHELVKAHAEKLGYWREENDLWKYDAKLICLWDDGGITLSNMDDLLNEDLEELKKFQEISWQDFLKLTPGDVEIWGNPEGDYDIGNLLIPTPELTETIKRDLAKDKPTTTDRNEKAWELFKILLAKPGLDEQLYKLEQEAGKDLGIKVYASMAFDLADEFLKQAGNK